jgi:MerR family transcriptional regulator, repressor of the yfmOP operon
MATARTVRRLRIGEVARRLGVTTRTIRYYEELGLLPSLGYRPQGVHRVYDEAAIARLQQILKLRDLLGLSLEAIIEIADADTSREALRDTWDADPGVAERARILDEAKPLVLHQLELVKARQAVLSRFSRELRKTLRAIEERRAALDAEEAAGIARASAPAG